MAFWGWGDEGRRNEGEGRCGVRTGKCLCSLPVADADTRVKVLPVQCLVRLRACCEISSLLSLNLSSQRQYLNLPLFLSFCFSLSLPLSLSLNVRVRTCWCGSLSHSLSVYLHTVNKPKVKLTFPVVGNLSLITWREKKKKESQKGFVHLLSQPNSITVKLPNKLKSKYVASQQTQQKKNAEREEEEEEEASLVLLAMPPSGHDDFCVDPPKLSLAMESRPKSIVFRLL